MKVLSVFKGPKGWLEREKTIVNHRVSKQSCKQGHGLILWASEDQDIFFLDIFSIFVLVKNDICEKKNHALKLLQILEEPLKVSLIADRVE